MDSTEERRVLEAGFVGLDRYVSALTPSPERDRAVARYHVPKQLEVHRATQITDAIWRTIKRYAGEEIDDATRAHGGIVSAETRAARNNIRLADAYYDAYYSGRDEIQPIVLYYGSLNLAKALSRVVVGSDAGDGGHGITVLTPELPLETAVVRLSGEGDFAWLMLALGCERLPADVTVSILELLQLLPELDESLRHLMNVGTRAVRVFPRGSTIVDRPLVDVNLGIELPDDSEGWIEQLAALPALVARKASINRQARELTWAALHNDPEADYRALTIPGSGDDRYLERRLPSGLHIPPAAAMLAVQFYLSHLCRYRADAWLKTMDDHPRSYSLMREFMILSEIRMPNTILNELAQTDYVFTAR